MAGYEPRTDALTMESTQSFQPGMAEDGAVSAPAGASGPAPMLLGAGEFAAYERHLAELRDLRDRKLPERLRAARGFVGADAAEEIAHIQAQQTVMDARIARLVDLLGAATVVPEDEAGDAATIGSTVEVEYLGGGTHARYRLTGAASGTESGGVSARSPIGRALLGRRVGDVVSAGLPGGRVEELRVESISATLPRRHAHTQGRSHARPVPTSTLPVRNVTSAR